MNRKQRRMKETGLSSLQNKNLLPTHNYSPKINIPDFANVPLSTMCQSLQLLINEISNRGYPIYDFDNKRKHIYSIKIIKNKVYFLAAEEMDYEKEE